MKHRLNRPRRSPWSILRDAGLLLIVVMGLALLALAVGAAIGMRMMG